MMARETRAEIDALAAQLVARAAASDATSPLTRAASSAPRLSARLQAATPAAFVPQFAPCADHGPYPLNAVDADGTERWHAPGCPACRRLRSAAQLMQRAAIAPRFAHCTFDNYQATTPDQQGVLDACRAYARDFEALSARGICLILSGAPGTGKNHLATAITRALLARGRTVMNATAHELVRRIRDTWQRSAAQFGNPAALISSTPAASSETTFLREIAALDLLIIDEAGRAYPNRDGSEPIELFNLIDARYRGMKPTMVLSNFDSDGIRAALGAAAYDRLREGGAPFLALDWPSHRAGPEERIDPPHAPLPPAG